MTSVATELTTSTTTSSTKSSSTAASSAVKVAGGTGGAVAAAAAEEARDHDSHDVEAAGQDRNTWKCPDPGCKKSNSKSEDSCTQCHLPKHSAHQFKRGSGGGRHDGRGGGGGGRRGGGGGSGRRHHGHHGAGYRREYREEQNKAFSESLDPNNPIVKMFLQYANDLDTRYDKHERLVKLSRDITIESKRVIFLLHRIKNDEDMQVVLQDAEKRFSDIENRLWFYVAKELQGEDPFQFLKAYTNGLQEYVEAFSFYHYICFKKLITWKEVQDRLVFRLKDLKKKSSKVGDSSKVDDEPNTVEDVKKKGQEMTGISGGRDGIEPKVENEPRNDDDSSPTREAETCITVLVPKTDFVLGLADLTGEIMRRAINGVGCGDTDLCFELSAFLHEVYNGFMTINGSGFENKEMRRKIYTLVQSLKKVETACYTINVRGSEIPKHKLADYFQSGEMEHHIPAATGSETGFGFED